MSIDYSYDSRARLIRIACKGEVSISDRIHLMSKLFGDPHLPARSPILINVNEVTNAPSFEEIGVIGLLVERLMSRFHDRVAIVNVTVGHVTLSQMVSLSVGDKLAQVQVFPSEADARDWFGS